MITQILQSQVRPSHLVQSHHVEAPFLPIEINENSFRALIHRIKGRLTKVLKQQSSETEIRKAIKYLHDLSNEQLLDMGITRMDIAHVVRYGKD